MELRARDYRKMAAEACKPFSGMLALLTLLYEVMLSVASLVPFGVLVLGGPFTLGYIAIIRHAASGKKPEAMDLFDGFNKFGESFVTYLLQTIYVFLWSLLLIIPGIIKTYSYAMSFYLIKDEGLSGNAAITRSRELMHGNKWKLFCLDFSYIGWIILCILTLGILFFWVTPKMEMARYKFYLHITGKDVEVPAAEEAAPQDAE